jgi:hypothetical protein
MLSDLVAFDPNSGVLYPGSLVHGKSLNSGILDPILADRSSGTITVEDLTIIPDAEHHHVSASQQVNVVDNRSVRDAILGLVQQKLGATPANMNLQLEQLDTYQSAMLRLGLDASWPTGQFQATFGRRSASGRRALVALFTQKYYTVSYQRPNDSKSFFATGVRAADLIRRHQLDLDDPAAYVSQVTYGRQMILRMESTYSFDEMDHALRVSISSAGSSVAAGYAAVDSAVMRSGSFSAYITGGSADTAARPLADITPEAIAAFVRGGANFSPVTSPAVPISYQVRFLRRNQLARLARIQDYRTESQTSASQNFTSFKIHFWTDGDNKDKPESFNATLTVNGNVVGTMGPFGAGVEWDDHTNNGEVAFSNPVAFSAQLCRKAALALHKNPDNPGSTGSGWDGNIAVAGRLEDGRWVAIIPETTSFPMGDHDPMDVAFAATCPF